MAEKMDRLFRIDFYPQDWLIDTARLTPEERGIYIQIVCLIYANRGPIENNPQWIAGVSGCSTRLVKTIIERLEQKLFIQFSGEKIGQKRAENELRTKREHLELSSKGGRKTSENFIREKENNDLNSTDTPFSVGTPSPSPTAIARRKKDTNVSSKRSPEKPKSRRALFEADDLSSMAEWFRKNAPAVDPIRLRGIMLDWCDAKGKTYQNYHAALRQWANKDQERHNQGKFANATGNHEKPLSAFTGHAAHAEIHRRATVAVEREKSQRAHADNAAIFDDNRAIDHEPNGQDNF